MVGGLVLAPSRVSLRGVSSSSSASAWIARSDRSLNDSIWAVPRTFLSDGRKESRSNAKVLASDISG